MAMLGGALAFLLAGAEAHSLTRAPLLSYSRPRPPFLPPRSPLPSCQPSLSPRCPVPSCLLDSRDALALLPLRSLNLSSATPTRETPLPPPLFNPSALSRASDTLLAGAGAGFSLWALSFLEASTGVPCYAPPLAASAIILFSPYSPPRAQDVLLSSAVVSGWSVALCLTFGDNSIVRSLAIGSCLLWFKLLGASHPPAAALAALFYDSAEMISKGPSFVLCPVLSGHVILYIIASSLSPLRQNLRLEIARRSLRSSADLVVLRDQFDGLDTNEDHLIGASELGLLLGEYEIGLCPADCEALLRTITKDDTVSWDQFAQLLSPDQDALSAKSQ